MDRYILRDILIYVFIILGLPLVSSCEKINLDTKQTEDDETLESILNSSSHLIIYNGHVGFTTQNGTILFISKVEWCNLSASDENIELLTSTYVEDGITEWRQPSREEAKLLKEFHLGDTPDSEQGAYTGSPFGSYILESITDGSTYAPLNFILSTIDGTPLSTGCRYLCESSTYSFSFAPGTTISKVGTKKSDYRLRLVKNISQE